MRTTLTILTAMTMLAGLVHPGCSPDETEGEPTPDRKLSTQPVTAGSPMDEAHKKTAQRMVKDGLQFLLSKQDKSGGWRINTPVGPAYTALILKALVQHPDFNSDSPEVKKGIEYLLSFRGDDGGFYDPANPGFANYTSAIALMSFNAMGDEKFDGVKDGVIAYLKGLQIKPGSKTPKGRTVGQGEDIEGGMGYGTKGRPDLSNTGISAEALHQAGLDPDDPAMQRLLGFVTRLQNRTESNKTIYAKAGSNDGGFYYAIDESKVMTPAGVLAKPSYGSMTCMGLKTMIYAGVTKDDPRVRAAFDWIRKHWTLEQNAGLPPKQALEGLYYYYHTFAKALGAWGEDIVTDADGVEHNWREELIDELASRQADGRWANKESRWMENDEYLVTAYVVLTLQEMMR